MDWLYKIKTTSKSIVYNLIRIIKIYHRWFNLKIILLELKLNFMKLPSMNSRNSKNRLITKNQLFLEDWLYFPQSYFEYMLIASSNACEVFSTDLLDFIILKLNIMLLNTDRLKAGKTVEFYHEQPCNYSMFDLMK